MMSDIVYSDDVRNYNTFDNPELVRAVEFKTELPEINIPPHSVIRIVFNA